MYLRFTSVFLSSALTSGALLFTPGVGRLSPRSESFTANESAPQQDDDVVRVNADLVVLNATVLDKQGKFVAD